MYQASLVNDPETSMPSCTRSMSMIGSGPSQASLRNTIVHVPVRSAGSSPHALSHPAVHRLEQHAATLHSHSRQPSSPEPSPTLAHEGGAVIPSSHTSPTDTSSSPQIAVALQPDS